MIGGKKKKRLSLIYCYYFKVTICVESFVPFCTNPQLVDAKRSMAILFSSNDDGEEWSENLESLASSRVFNGF